MKQTMLSRSARALPAWALLFVVLGMLLVSPPSHAAAAAPVVDKGDVAWMLTSTLLVLLMTVPGLALFYGGLVRSKNVLSILMQVMTVFSMILVLWAIYGYSLAFNGGNAFIGNLDKLFLRRVSLVTPRPPSPMAYRCLSMCSWCFSRPSPASLAR